VRTRGDGGGGGKTFLKPIGLVLKRGKEGKKKDVLGTMSVQDDGGRRIEEIIASAQW